MLYVYNILTRVYSFIVRFFAQVLLFIQKILTFPHICFKWNPIHSPLLNFKIVIYIFLNK